MKPLHTFYEANNIDRETFTKDKENEIEDKGINQFCEPWQIFSRLRPKERAKVPHPCDSSCCTSGTPCKLFKKEKDEARLDD